jgi:O-antigen ligase
MKLRLRKFWYFLIGSLILIPFNFFILETQIFYVQTLLVVFLLVFLVFRERRIRIHMSRKSLTPYVLFYIGWTLISFSLNFVFSFDDLEMQGRRVISMGIALLLSSGFFIGRALHNIETNTESMVKGIFFTYLLVMIYIAFIFLSQPSLDLYLVRRVIGQRLPFVIAFVSSLAAVYFFLEKPKKFYYFFMMTSGILAVVFSLTRAAYIQIVVSFVILFMKQIRKYFLRGTLIVILFLATGIAFLKLFGEYPSVKQVTSRVELLLDVKAQSEQDVSGSFRLEMWKFLINDLLEDPVRLMIGYGQLGPTHVARDFVSSDGTRGNNAHNQYLDIVVREGIIGLFLFVWLCYRLLLLGFSIKNVSTYVKLFLIANSIALIGVLFYGFFHETFRYPLFGFYFWLYAGIASKITELENSVVK